MNLYYVTNGYTGYGEIGMIVLANNEEEAEHLAMIAFKEEGIRDEQPKGYWTGLKVVFVREFEYEAQVIMGTGE